MKIAFVRFEKVSLAFCLSLFCASCVSMESLSSSVAPPDKDHGYFIIGVKPYDASILVFKGSVVGGRFEQEKFVTASFNGMPTDGFVVSDSHAGNTLAITWVKLASPPNLMFAPCGNAKTIVFKAAAGKVVYVGSAEYALAGSGVSARMGNDFEGARVFLQTHYPQLAGALEQGTYQLMPAGDPQCP